MARPVRLRAWIAVALLLAACGICLWGPWHGPVILSLSSSHGIDAGDLPTLVLLALALALASGPAREHDARAGPRRSAGRWASLAVVLVLGGLLIAGVVDDPSGREPLLPAGGGTFGGTTLHADAQQADPVDSWTHVAATYDGTMLRLYVNGTRVSSRAKTGAILKTTDPLWIGGSRPYGEYFHGLIDEVRVYERALKPSEVRAEMSTPVRSVSVTPAAGLVAAYAFDRDPATLAADASGNGNAGEIIGATRTTRGRFGGALRFDAAGAVVRVPASASLDLSAAMTLSGWIRPRESQAGWRTILHRQTDAYFLMAGGGGGGTRLGAFDDARLVLLVGIGAWFWVTLARGDARWFGGRRRWWWAPIALFLAGSVLDATLAPSGALIGPALVAIWCALTASHRSEAAVMYLIAAVFGGLTLIHLAGWGGLEFARDDGGVARSAALGALLVTAGVLSACYGLPGEGRPLRPRADRQPVCPTGRRVREDSQVRRIARR